MFEIKHIDIRLPIAKKPWSQKDQSLESGCRKALYDFDMVPKNGKIAIALSGGKDSLSLLYLLHEIKGRGFADFELFAIHVTGAFTCGAGVSLDLIRSICRELNVPFILKTANQNPDTLACYSCSRVRRSLLFEGAKECEAHTIAFGHHQDDHTETLLMNLFHKGEFEGIQAKIHMEKYQMTIIRPLFYIQEEAIVGFAKRHGFARITCQCPVGQNSLRKKTKGLISEIERHYPNLKTNLVQACENYATNKALKA